MQSKPRFSFRDNKKVIGFLGGQAVSLFGSSLVQYALMWNIIMETKSGTMTALYTVCMFLPQIILSMFGGALADRHNRKLLIMLSDGGIAIATVILCGIMVFRDLGYAPVFIIAAIRSLGGGIQSPAVSALLPQIVPEDKLLRMNTINAMLQSVMMLVSPAAAMVAIRLLPLPGVLLIDAVTAVIGIGILLPIHIPTHERTSAEEKHIFHEMHDGYRYLMGNPFLRRMTLYYVISSILIVPAAMFTPLYVERAYAHIRQLLYWPITDSGTLLMLNEMVFFVGSLLGGAIISAWGGFKNRIATLSMGSIIFGLATLTMGFRPAFLLYLAFMAFAGLSMPCFQGPVMSLLQEKIVPDMMGRVFGLMQIASTSIMMFASLAFGIMSDQSPLEIILVACGLLLAVMGVVMLLDKSFMKEGLARPAESIPAPAET